MCFTCTVESMVCVCSTVVLSKEWVQYVARFVACFTDHQAAVVFTQRTRLQPCTVLLYHFFFF